MKGNRIASICAYVSLAISVVMMVLWCCNVGGFTVVSLDSFVGVIVALLAIVVTLAIAWQIYNAVELKQKVEELNIIKSQLEEQEKSLNQIAYRFIIILAILWEKGICGMEMWLRHFVRTFSH